MARMAFYKTADGRVFCDPCSLRVCAAEPGTPLHRTYGIGSGAVSFPTLTCEACGARHRVAQS